MLDQQRQARERAEQEAFTRAKSIGTKSSLNEFIRLYPKSKYVAQARIIIEDYDLWQNALQVNTIEGYYSYLRQSSNKCYEDEARTNIASIEAVNAWQSVRNSRNLTELQTFVSKYPQSEHTPELNRRIHELKGEQYYNSGNLSYAFSEFNQAGGRIKLSSDNQQRYDRASDYNDYSLLNKNDEKAMISFLSLHPNSEYRNDVSNTIARKKASNLSAYSSEYQYNQVMSYACDNETRQYVQSKINESKRSYSQIKRAQKSARIKENGGYVGIGFDLFDLDVNIWSKENDRTFNALHYNMALALRIGNFKTPVYLEIGVKPGMILIKDLDYGSEEIHYNFHMPVFAKLKLNLFKAWGNTKFYIDGIGYYNAIRLKEYEAEFSVGGGFGVAGRHWDWQMIYYRQDLDKNNMYNNNDLRYFGMSLGYFF